MTELELQQYLLREYPQENARCEWKEFKNLKNSFCGDEKDDVISYVSAIAFWMIFLKRLRWENGCTLPV